MITKDVLEKIFGVSTFENDNPLVDTVGTTPVQIFADNPGRLEIIIVNLSTNDVYIAPYSDVSSSKGILLSPSGGSYSFNFRDDGLLPTRAWYAVASGASSALTTEEVNIMPQ